MTRGLSFSKLPYFFSNCICINVDRPVEDKRIFGPVPHTQTDTHSSVLWALFPALRNKASGGAQCPFSLFLPISFLSHCLISGGPFPHKGSGVMGKLDRVTKHTPTGGTSEPGEPGSHVKSSPAFTWVETAHQHELFTSHVPHCGHFCSPGHSPPWT